MYVIYGKMHKTPPPSKHNLAKSYVRFPVVPSRGLAATHSTEIHRRVHFAGQNPLRIQTVKSDVRGYISTSSKQSCRLAPRARSWTNAQPDITKYELGKTFKNGDKDLLWRMSCHTRWHHDNCRHFSAKNTPLPWGLFVPDTLGKGIKGVGQKNFHQRGGHIRGRGELTRGFTMTYKSLLKSDVCMIHAV